MALDPGDLFLRDNMRQEYMYDESGNKIVVKKYLWKNEENIGNLTPHSNLNTIRLFPKLSYWLPLE